MRRRRPLALLVALLLAHGSAAAGPRASAVRAKRAEVASAIRGVAAATAAPGHRTLLGALHAVVAQNVVPPDARTDRASGLAIDGPVRQGKRRGLRAFLFHRLPAVARTLYDAERLTEERVMSEVALDVFGVQLGLTLSQIDTVKPRGKGELVHVVNLDGSSNVELIAKRFEVGHGQRIELQGPALNGGDALGGRLVGVGLTGDVLSGRAPKGTSYTLEAKVTDHTLARGFELVAPLALEGLRQVLQHSVSDGLARVLAMSVPGVSAALAAISIRRAIRTLRSPDARVFAKVLGVGHAVADIVRVVDPILGTVVNTALVAVSVGVSAVQIATVRHQALLDAHARAVIDAHEQEPPPPPMPPTPPGVDPRYR